MDEPASPAAPILHLISLGDWSEANEAGAITPPSLADEGFVHCSTEAQLPGVVNRFYADRTDMLALTLDPSALGDAELRWEAPAHPDGSPNTEADETLRFPHIYGPIPVAAVLHQRRIT